MPASPPVTPLKFELRARKLKGAPKDLPEEPAILKDRFTGSHPDVHTEAQRLNNMQTEGGAKATHFFYPEVVGSGANWRLHCDACKRLAAKQAHDED